MKTLSRAPETPNAAGAPSNELLPTRKPARLFEVDHAKGFAIALVVWGHIAGSTTPLTPAWFNVSVGVIYSFHMPFFMYLSGYVFFAIGAHQRFLRQPATYTAQRFNRLMIPFIGFATVVVIGKYFAASLGPLDDDVGSLSSGFYDVLTNSPGNPCIAVWYLLCLFIYSVTSPVLWRLGMSSTIFMILLGCAGWMFEIPQSFYADRIAQYFIFFAVAAVVAIHRETILPAMKRWVAVTLPLFLLLCYVTLGKPYGMLVCGLAAIPPLHGMFLYRFWRHDRVFLLLGKYSLTIYLLNTIAIGVFKIAYLPRFSYDGDNFYIYFVAIFGFGLLSPILVLKVMERVPRSAFITRYLR